jgi:DNA-binding transcriptional MerR regulator
MARRASTVRRRKHGRRRGVDAAALVSRDAFCVLSGVSERELALWEHEALLAPARVMVLEDGRREPFYTADTLRRARLIRTLAEELEVNLPGIDIILNLLDQMGR